ncbi:MAG TPA: hypothetical protein VN754_12305 [Candidatus Binataceae bacterium]|nr:hypothetical protein [Candidatus Binataceae bacterium]
MADTEALKRRKLDLRYQLRFRLIELASQIVDRGIPVTGLVLAVYFGIFRPIHDLAGRNTQAQFGTALLADIRPSEIVSYVFGLAGWVFGLSAQRLRRNVTERLTGRIAELERKNDPSRTSSGLTTRGETPPEKKS